MVLYSLEKVQNKNIKNDNNLLNIKNPNLIRLWEGPDFLAFFK